MQLAIDLIEHQPWPITSYRFIPDRSLARDEAVLILPSAPWDALRSSWLLKQLQEQLCRAGFEVFRLDYTGTGESIASMSEARWKDWLAEVQCAREFMRSKIKKIHVIGLRLGASLALLSSENFAYRSLHLLDPILDGPSYWRELLDMQRQFEFELNRFGANIRTQDELLAYPLGADWQQAFQSLDLTQFIGRGKRLYLYRSFQDQSFHAWLKRLQEHDWEVRELAVDDDFAWNVTAKLNFQIFCRQTVQEIVQALGEF